MIKMNCKNHEREKIFKKQRGVICLCIMLLFALLNGCADTEKNADEEKRINQDTSEFEQIVTITESPVKENLPITNTPVIDGGQDVDTNINNNFDVVDIEKTPISCRIENGTLYFSGEGCLTKTIVMSLMAEVRDDIEEQGTIKLVIEEGITRIGAEAFLSSNYFEEIEIAGSVVGIGSNSFESCNKLETVKVLEGVQYIDMEAFSDCRSLRTVEIPESIEIISRGAFSETLWLKEQRKEKPVVMINGILIAVNEELVEKETLNNVLYTPNYAFDYPEWIEKENITNGLYIVNGVLIDGSSASGDVVIPEGVRYISDGAFYECEKLTGITIPDSVEGIGTMAFYCCSNLAKIEIPDSVKWLGSAAFVGCTNLNNVKLSNGLDGIEAFMFQQCTNLVNIVFPEKIEYIDIGAFVWCDSLENIVLPEGLSVIGGSAFSGCTCLSSVAFPNTLGYLGERAFEGCKKLTSIDIPKKIKRIEGETFAQTGLIEIQIPDSIQYIGEKAFWFCSSLIRVDIPESVMTIGYKAFDKTPWLESKLKNNPLLIINDCLIAVSAVEGTVSIPENVRIIGAGAFENSNVEKIEIPETVREIKTAAFLGCANLEEVKLSNHITILEEGVFEGCTSLTNVKLPNELCEIGDSAFENCTSLESIEIPKSVSRIGAYAFSGCGNLISIEIPEAVQEIAYSVFENCDNLLAVVIPEGVTKINPRAFGLCEKLVSIAIPKSVVEINSEKVFLRCDQLTIYCDRGSYAEQYAKENEIEYITVDEEFWSDGAPIPLTPPSLQEKLRNNPNRMIDVNGDECYAVWGETGAYVWRYVDATFEQRAYTASGFAGDMADFYSITDLSWDARLLTNWCKWFDWEELKVKHIGNDMFLVEAKFDEYIAVYYVNGQTNRAMQAKDWVQDKDDAFYLKTNFNDGYAIGIYKDSYDKYSETLHGYYKTFTDYKIATVDLNGTISVSDIDESNSAVGIYSDGLFYYGNAFYDINFSKVLDLSENGWGNANTEYSIPHFENGICRLITYKNGKYWTFEIDKSGNMLTEVEEYDTLSSN
ncbi:MAG: leucine-rich repeat domain-containing protein [Lachnospiraceae bacterium]|nr:leucine-rich repeat domain-containing protein [Lachnospiraceae bacterium]